MLCTPLKFLRGTEIGFVTVCCVARVQPRAVYASAERTHSRRQARGRGPQDNGCASLVEFKTASAGKIVTATYWDMMAAAFRSLITSHQKLWYVATPKCCSSCVQDGEEKKKKLLEKIGRKKSRISDSALATSRTRYCHEETKKGAVKYAPLWTR